MSNTAIVAMSYPEMKVLDRLLITTKKAKKGTAVNTDSVRRARLLYEGAHSFVKKWKLDKEVLAMMSEIPSGSQSADGMKSYGMSCMLTASFIGSIEIDPDDVKLASVGSKTATKEEVITWAMEKHPELEWYLHKKKGEMLQTKKKNEHLADAVAVIYAAMKTPEFQRIKHLL